VNLNLIDHNIWKDVKSPRLREPEPTHAYSVEEANAILQAIKRTDSKLLFALCAFQGLRPSEAAGLRWEDVRENQLQIRQAVVRGAAGGSKTKKSQRFLHLIEPTKSLLEAWREKCGKVTEGLLFTGNGGHLNTSVFAKHTIKPDVEKAKLPFHGLYAARRGCATNLVALTGNVNAAHQVLGNSLAASMAKYTKAARTNQRSFYPSGCGQRESLT
jgi:integrase